MKKMTTKINPDDICWNKTADYYMDPIGLATLLLEELVDWGKERDEMVANGYPETHISYFDGVQVARETILSRLGVENIPVVGDC